MIKVRSLGATLVLVVSAAQARAESPCRDARTTVEMNECLTAEIKSAEAELNRYLAEARRSVSDRPSVQAALDRSQKTWNAFREAECDAVYELFVDGTIRGVMGGNCVLERTRRRTHDLWSTYLKERNSGLAEPDLP